MKENYKAWIIDYQKFYRQPSLKEQLQFLIGFAVLAPSGHNSQPWKFRIEKNAILLLPEPKRALLQSDPVDRQLYISLGCALENLLIAADFYNFEFTIQYLPPDHENVAAKIVFNKKENTDIFENHLIFSIPKRRTNRSKYENFPPGQQNLEWIKKFQDEDIRIDLIEEKNTKEAAAEISLHALLNTMDKTTFRNELSVYLKSNFTNSKVGMPGFLHGIPAPVSLIAPKLIRKVNVNKLSKKQDEALLKKFTPIFCIISSKKDDKKNWIKAGQIYERIALEAEKRNIKNAPLAAAMENERYNEELKKLLHLTHRPQIFLRLGVCNKTAPLSPRLTSTDVIKSVS